LFPEYASTEAGSDRATSHLDAALERQAKGLMSVEQALDTLVSRVEGLIRDEPRKDPHGDDALAAVQAPQSRVVSCIDSHSNQIGRMEQRIRSVIERLDA
jgi:hypothetical protein